MAPLIERHPRFAGWAAAVAEALLAGPAEVAVVARPDLVRLARLATAPGAVVVTSGPLAEGKADPGVYVCRGFVCELPGPGRAGGAGAVGGAGRLSGRRPAGPARPAGRPAASRRTPNSDHSWGDRCLRSGLPDMSGQVGQPARRVAPETAIFRWEITLYGAASLAEPPQARDRETPKGILVTVWRCVRCRVSM